MLKLKCGRWYEAARAENESVGTETGSERLPKNTVGIQEIQAETVVANHISSVERQRLIT